MRRKIWSIMIAATLVLTFIPGAVFAIDGSVPESDELRGSTFSSAQMNWDVEEGNTSWIWPDSKRTLYAYVNVQGDTIPTLEYQWLSGDSPLTEWTEITEFQDDSGERYAGVSYDVSASGTYRFVVREKNEQSRKDEAVYTVYAVTVVDNVIYEPMFEDKVQAYAIGDRGCKGDIKILPKVKLADGKTYSTYVVLAYAPESTSITIPEDVVELQIVGFKEYYYDDNWSGYVGKNPIPGFVIYGKKGSAAESYANKKGFTFIEGEGPVPVNSNDAGTTTTAATARDAASNINKATVTVSDIKKASDLGATSVTLGAMVKKISPKAFKGTNIKTVTVKTKKLKAAKVKNSLRGSKVTTIKVKVGKKKENKKYVKKYKKIFTKKNCGRKVSIK